MSRYFNAKRFLLIMRRELLLNKTGILIMFLSLTLLSLVIAFFSAIIRVGNNVSWEHAKYFPYICAIYSIVITSNCFSELNSSDRKIEFLMLPASTLEKYLTKYIYTTVILFLLISAALLMSGLIVKVWNPRLPHGDAFKDIFASWDKVTYGNIVSFLQQILLVHSVFFFGAVYFRKMELAKTFISIIGVFLTVQLFSVILSLILPLDTRLAHPNDFLVAINSQQKEYSYSWQSHAELYDYFHKVRDIIEFISKYLLPVFLWTLSYVRLMEAEVNDGV